MDFIGNFTGTPTQGFPILSRDGGRGQKQKTWGIVHVVQGPSLSRKGANRGKPGEVSIFSQQPERHRAGDSSCLEPPMTSVTVLACGVPFFLWCQRRAASVPIESSNGS